VLRSHQAADGALLRLRVPGGWVPASTLDAIGAAAARFGDGDVQVTSRANLQLRAVVTEPSGGVAAALVDEVVRAGLLPHPSHERVRNIVCSPLSGLAGGLADLRGLTCEVDEKLCAAADLAELPGPFLFALDDGRGDLDAVPADLRVRAVDRDTVQLLVGDAAIGPVVPLGRAADLIIELGRAFLGVQQGEPIWHVRELPQRGLELFSQVDAGPATLVRRKSATAGLPLGRLTQDDGRAVLSALAPLGLLDRRQVAALTAAAALGSGQLVITPWRGVLVPDLPFSEAGIAAGWLAAAGLELADGSPWQGVTACTGAPRCAHGLGETRLLAGRVVQGRLAGTANDTLPVHVVGCSRRCGSPSGPHVEVLSWPDRVEISRDGEAIVVPVAEAPAAVWGGR
jgi:precorrin-3B synthase